MSNRRITVTLSETEARAASYALHHCLADILEAWSVDGSLATKKIERDAERLRDAAERALTKLDTELNDKHPKECLCGNCP